MNTSIASNFVAGLPAFHLPLARTAIQPADPIPFSPPPPPPSARHPLR